MDIERKKKGRETGREQEDKDKRDVWRRENEKERGRERGGMR